MRRKLWVLVHSTRCAWRKMDKRVIKAPGRRKISTDEYLRSAQGQEQRIAKFGQEFVNTHQRTITSLIPDKRDMRTIKILM